MSLTLTFDKASYSSGDSGTATYSGVVLGSGTPDKTVSVTGSASVDGGPAQPVTGTFVIKGTAGDTVVYNPPTATGITFTVTANPAVYGFKVP